MTEEATQQGLASTEGLGLLPEPAGFRTRYRSEPGMIGHYPWTYADQSRRRVDRPSCESEDLYTAEQVRALLAEERERIARVFDARDKGAGGFYEPQEPAEIIRALGPNCEDMAQ